jgi:hypothetical protein
MSLPNLGLRGAVLNKTATDGFRFADSEFCSFSCFHGEFNCSSWRGGAAQI